MRFEEECKEECINLSNFILQNRIGQGSYGKVYKAKEKNTNEIYAVKVSIQEIDNNTSDQITNLSREVNIISKLNHPSVLKFKGYSPIDFKKRKRPVIITEYASNGTLEDLILSERDKGSHFIFTDTQKLIIIYGIASAMQYLHSHNIIHRDLKPANILIDSFLFPKVADFGLSKIKHSKIESMTIKSIIGSIKGTPVYMSPEIWERAEYSKASDVYAFAIILYEILTNQKPFDGFNFWEIPLKVKEGYRPEIDVQIPKSYQDLITSCWEDDASLRPNFDSIVKTLQNDNGFITEKVNKEQYMNYISYINEYKISFDQSIFINCFETFKKINEFDQLKAFKYFNYFSIKPIFFTFKEFIQLGDSCKILVEKASNDPEKQFLLSKCLIEGQELFERNRMVGIRYLTESMKSGFIDSAIYYCKILIKGKIIHRNLKKAKKILETKIKEQEPSFYYLLSGQINKKEKKYDESLKLFEKSILLGNNEALYEYGLLLFKEKYSLFNKEESIQYFQKAIEKNCVQAMYKYGVLLIKGEYIEKNEEEGIKYIKMAAEQGHSNSLYYYSNWLKNKQQNSFEYLKKAAYKGNEIAMFEYGYELIEIDKNESLLFLKKASDAGILDAIRLYGHILGEGKGFPIDYKKSARLIKIIADIGDISSIVNYGVKLIQGKGVDIDKEKAVEYFKKAVDKGDSQAMNNYAVMLKNGDGIEMNKEEAIKYFKLAADKGNLNAILNYARSLFYGEGIEMNKEESIKYYKMAIDKGDSNAMYSYALMLEDGDGIEMNKEEAIKYYKMAIDKGNSDSLLYYANMLYKGEGIEMNKEEAMKYYKMAIDKGNSRTMYNYACMLCKGDGIEMNKEEAIRYFKMAIDKGNSDAMLNYAFMLYKGEGIEMNKEEAIKYFKMAIDKGNSDAMYNYAIMLYKGEGIEMNKEEAIKYFKMAINKGNSDAMYNYALMLENGIGIEMNKELAIEYYKMAIDKGNSDAMYNYACMLVKGEGTPANHEKAIEYMKMALERDNEKALVFFTKLFDE